MIFACKGRLFAPAVCSVLALVVACSNDGDDTSAPSGPPPSGVPTAAVPAMGQQIGDIEPTPANAADVRFFESLACADGIMTIVTTHETVYALIPCDRSLPADVASRFEGVAVRLRIVPGDPSKLFLETAAQGTAEFTVDGVWIAPHN